MRSCKIRVTIALTSLLWLAVRTSVSSAQAPALERPAASDQATDAIFAAWRGDPEVQRCGVCHYSPGNLFAERDRDFCRLNELEVWLQNDKHAIARQRIEPIPPSDQAQAKERARRLLSASSNTEIELAENWIGESNFLSFAMCQQLGYDVQTEEGYAKFRDNCLTCHGGYNAECETDSFAQGNVHHPGISCSYCHQICDDERWIDEHSGFQAKATWRTLPPSAKAEKGMRDLVTADAQSKLCLRCHVGDLKHNMFVTHQMYAAGHPPLPGVELHTLAREMPRHWQSPDELYKSLKNYPQRTTYFATNIPILAEVANEQTRIDQLPWQIDAMVTGALASQQQSLRLLAQAADSDSAPWGDYALYDCAACHHELRVPSARQAVRRPGAPGRPRLLEWPQALSHAAAAASGESEDLSLLNARLMQAVTQRPFGERVAVRQAAAELDEALEQLKQRTTARRLSDSFTRDMLIALVQTPDELLIDYHAARQINWAIRCIDTELQRLEKPLSPDVRAAIAELGSGAAPGSVRISTVLPTGQNQSIYPEFVKTELERQANYDSQEFAQQLKQLSALLLSKP